MKKNAIKLSKPLRFDKETIAQLDEEQLGTIAGGKLDTQTCHDDTKVAAEAEFPTIGSCNACSCNG